MYDIAANLQTPNIANTFAQSYQAGQDMQANRFKLNQAKRSDALATKRQGYGNLYSGAVSAEKPFSARGFYGAALQDATAAGDGEQAMAYTKAISDHDSALAKLSKEQLESAKTGIEFQGQLLGSVTDQASWDSAMAQAKNAGMDVSGFPAQFDPRVVQQLTQQALSAKDRLDQTWKAKNLDQSERKFTYERGNDTANRGVTIQGQNLVNARAQEANNIAANTKAEGRIEGAAGVDIAMDTLNTLANHPGLNSGTGSIMAPLMRNIPGSDAKGFASQVEQFKSQVFLPAVQAMKGMGQLSNAEGAALTKAIGNLDPDMGTAEFKKQALKIYSQMEAARNRKYSDIPKTDLGDSGSSSALKIGTIDNGYVFLGGDIKNQSNWKKAK